MEKKKKKRYPSIHRCALTVWLRKVCKLVIRLVLVPDMEKWVLVLKNWRKGSAPQCFQSRPHPLLHICPNNSSFNCYEELACHPAGLKMSSVWFGKASKNMQGEYLARRLPGNLSHPEYDTELEFLVNIRPQKWDKWRFFHELHSNDRQGLNNNNINNKIAITCIYWWFKTVKLSHTQCLPCPHQCEWASCHGQASTHVPMPTLVKGVTCSSHPVACASATCSYCRDEELAQGVSCLQLEHPTWVRRMVWVLWCPPRSSQTWWFLFLTQPRRFLHQWPQNNFKIVYRCCQDSVLLLLRDPSHNQNCSTVVAAWDSYLTSKKNP